MYVYANPPTGMTAIVDSRMAKISSKSKLLFVCNVAFESTMSKSISMFFVFCLLEAAVGVPMEQIRSNTAIWSTKTGAYVTCKRVEFPRPAIPFQIRYSNVHPSLPTCLLWTCLVLFIFSVCMPLYFWPRDTFMCLRHVVRVVLIIAKPVHFLPIFQ